MIDLLKKLFGIAPSADFKKLVQENNAIIIDVRSKGEYQQGHINKSINLPVDSLMNNLGKLKDKQRPIITCCASGMRSGRAKSMLKAKGYEQVFNGGSWASLEEKIQ